MGSLGCYEICFACGSHSAVESMRVATCFVVVTERWPWEMPARPRFPPEDSGPGSFISLLRRTDLRS